MFKSIEDIGEEFTKAAHVETQALFLQGQVVKRAIEQGFDIDEVTGYCAGMIRRTKRTIYRYYSVARTFQEPLYGLSYEFHAIAADTIDYRQTDEKIIASEQEQARIWLQRAAEDNYSTRTLKAAIRAAGGNVDEKPIVLLDGVEATYVAFDDTKDHVILSFNTIPIEFYSLERLSKVFVTIILKAPSVEKSEA